MSFDSTVENGINFSAALDTDYSLGDQNNYFAIRYMSDPAEEIYGLGLQYSVWNWKGEKGHIISDEGGVGRGAQPITAYMNKEGGGQGGNPATTYAPASNWITNRERAFSFHGSTAGIADFTDENYSEMLFWHTNRIDGA